MCVYIYNINYKILKKMFSIVSFFLLQEFPAPNHIQMLTFERVGQST